MQIVFNLILNCIYVVVLIILDLNKGEINYSLQYVQHSQDAPCVL